MSYFIAAYSGFFEPPAFMCGSPVMWSKLYITFKAELNWWLCEVMGIF